MKTLSIGKNKEDISKLLGLLEEVDPRGEHWPSLSAERCRYFLEHYDVDTVFLDAEVSGASGIELGKELAEKYPTLNIVFLSKNKNDAFDAFQFYASAYLIKPIHLNDLIIAIHHLRYDIEIEDLPSVSVRCFGDFEVFVDGVPLRFKRSRTKELFAILVCHRGAMLSMARLMTILWEDGSDSKSDRSYLRTLIHDLKHTFEEMGAPDVIIKGYNTLSVDPAKIECDYYDFLNGKIRAISSYQGIFMNQYSWAEYEFSHDYSQ